MVDEPAIGVICLLPIEPGAGRDLRPKPLKEHRRVLERLVLNHGMVFPARRLSQDGFKAWEEAVARGYEGIVAKDNGSPYVAGRTLKWLKVKQRDYRTAERGWLIREAH
jgi:ATP-dependent DNA ligase